MCYFSAENYNSEMIQPMSTVLFDKIASDLFPRTKILFLGCGAEPLMSPKITDHLDTVGKYGVPHVSIVSNGLRLSEKIIASMINNNINELIISMDGFTKETYESIRTGSNFNLLIDNLKMLKEIKTKRDTMFPHLRINFIAMRRNYKELRNIIQASDSLCIRTIRVRPLGEWGGALDYKNEVLADEEYQALYLELKGEAKAKNVEFIYEGIYNSKNPPTTPEKMPVCMYPWYTIQVRGDGKVRFCPYFDYGTGDLSRQKFREFLMSKQVKKIKNNLRKNHNSCLYRCRGKFGGL